MRNLFKTGEVFIWFTGFGLAVTLLMVSGLLVLILLKGSNYYYPSKLASVSTVDGKNYLGQIVREEKIPKTNLPDSLRNENLERYNLKIANRDIYGLDFKWIGQPEIKSITYPEDAAVIERMEFGNFNGYPVKFLKESKTIIEGDENVESNIDPYLDEISDYRDEIDRLSKSEVGKINYKIEQLRLDIKKIEYDNRDDVSKVQDQIDAIEKTINTLNSNYELITQQVDSVKQIASRYSLLVRTADGDEKDINLLNIVRVYYPNRMTITQKVGFMASKIVEFLVEDPRESNTEGGVFPAIFGTVMMVILMSLVAVPFGVIAALYLREYAKQGAFVRLVRIAVNNLAGIPSIVFGVFGLGFFIYFIGGTIDKLFYPEILPTPTWGTGGILWASLTLALLTVPVVIVATEEALASIPRGVREASLALGSTKWQTIRRIVLPAAAPGILTGVILAMARGAGEVAPLMITGVVKLAPNLPLDGNFPFFHLDRKFMHLGFHIFDVGFQSPNVEAALPMVYMTTFLLIFIVVLLNISAMILRNRLRKKYKSSTF
jgi:phosphate transport system permease protein